MIARLTGRVIEREEKALIIDVSGIGYRVAVLGKTRERAKKDTEVVLLIHHHVSDSAQDLYGFNNKEQLEYFRMLLSVPSIGPKTALGILEAAPPSVLEQAVAENDITLLTKVSGVGKKTAERLLVELKTKIKSPKKTKLASGIAGEVVDALVSIGFSSAQAREKAANLSKSVRTVEEAVREALKEKSQ